MTGAARNQGQSSRGWWLPLARVGVLALCLALTGCGREEIYSELTEPEANEMLGLLLARGIQADKTPGKGETFVVSVPRSQFAQAVDTLKWYGLPKERFTSIGDLFQKSGIVSSPTEERVRFMFGLSQSISETLSQIDGVITARVNLVLPNNDPYASQNNPSSASVFLKFRPGAVPSTLIPQVKTLVMNSVEGLAYDKVSVTVVQSESIDYFFPEQSLTGTTDVLGGTVSSATLAGFDRNLILLVGGAVLGGAIFALLVLWIYGRFRKPGNEST